MIFSNKRFTVFALSFASFLILELLIYWNFANSVFAMDDPSLINHFQNPTSAILEKLFPSLVSNRFRPVPDILQFLAFQAFTNSYFYWVLLNLLILATTGALLSLLIFKINNSVKLAILGGALLVTSRFVLYQVTQANGLMEGAALLLFVGLLYVVLSDWKIDRRRTAYLAPGLFFLLVMTHERFQGLAVALMVWILFNSSLGKPRKYILLAGFISPLLVLSAFKLWWSIPLAVGTGSATELGLSWSAVPLFVVTVIINALGINFGPNYLFGLTIETQDFRQSLASYLLAGMTAVSIVKLVGLSRRIYPRHEGRLLISALFVAGLVAPIVSTIRVEPRWITTIFVICILVLVNLFSTGSREKSKTLLAVGLSILTLASLYLNISFLTNSNNIYFRNHQLTAEGYLKQWKPILAESQETNKPIVISSGCTDNEPANWFNSLIEANTRYDPTFSISCEEGLTDKPRNILISWDATAGKISRLN
jgi:hypothetical protein